MPRIFPCPLRRDSLVSAKNVRLNLSSIHDHLLEWSKKKHGNLALGIKKIREQLDASRSQVTWSRQEEAKLKLEWIYCLQSRKIIGKQDTKLTGSWKGTEIPPFSSESFLEARKQFYFYA